MRVLLVRFAGLALYIHRLQLHTLILTHERPDKDPRVHKVFGEDFDETADELDAEAFGRLEPGLEACTEGLNLRLIKNDGVLKIAYEDNHGGVVDWTFQGLTRMMASTSTQTMSEVLQPKIAERMIQTSQSELSIISTIESHPMPARVTQPLRSELSTISAIESYPIETPIGNPIEVPTKHQEEVLAQAEVVDKDKDKDLKRKKNKYAPLLLTHELARSTHNSRPWPNHLFMACYLNYPKSQSEVGVLHLDLTDGTVWFEAWHGRAHVSQQTYVRKQVDLRNASTIVGYYRFGGIPGQDFSTHQLRLSKVTTSQVRVMCFSADCSAPGYQVWGSDVYQSLDPIPNYSALAWNKARGGTGPPITIPSLPPKMTEHYTTPTIIINALVHCIDRASGRQPIHDPRTKHKLFKSLERGFRLHREGRLNAKDMLEWIAAIQEVKKRNALRRKMKVVEKMPKKVSKGKVNIVSAVDAKKRKSKDFGEQEDKDGKKAKIESDTAKSVTEDSGVTNSEI